MGTTRNLITYFIAGLVFALLVIFIIATANSMTHTCNKYSNTPIKDVPAQCISYFNL